MGAIPDGNGFTGIDAEVVSLAGVLRTIQAEAGLKFIARYGMDPRFPKGITTVAEGAET